MEDKQGVREVELAKRGVDAFVDRANELHHQGRHSDALKQLEVNSNMMYGDQHRVARAQDL